jgi:heat shock protein HslJ
MLKNCIHTTAMLTLACTALVLSAPVAPQTADKQVPLVGESADSASVMQLLTAPQTKGLFQRVIIMSGGGRGGLVGRQMTGDTRENPSAEQIDARFAKTLSIEGSGLDALNALRALPEKAVTGDLHLPGLLKEALQGAQAYSGTAMVDGTIVTGEPGDILRRAEGANVPVSIGTTKDRQVAPDFSAYFTNFLKHGDPNGKGPSAWPKFDPARFDLMDFTSDRGPVFRPGPPKGIALVERVAETQPPPQNAAQDLGGTSWQLVKFRGGDDTTLTPGDKAKYTIAFASDGRVSVQIDCNRGRGAWTSSGPNELQFGPLALTRKMCPPGSHHDRMAKHWEFVRSYIIKDGHLFLSLMADGGIYEFEPMGGSPSRRHSHR